jgi:hypothetical protein
VTEKEVIEAVKALDTDRQVLWMLGLGSSLTIAARNCYARDPDVGRIDGLMGFNEIQHRLFGRIREITAGNEWTIDSFVRGLIETASTYRISGEVAWAVKQSLRSLNHQ